MCEYHQKLNAAKEFNIVNSFTIMISGQELPI